MSFPKQTHATIVSGNGLIAIDEHSSVSCMIHDVTLTNLTLTLLDGTDVPVTFVLTVGCDMRVCRVVRRRDEEIEAAFADLGVADRAVVTTARTSRLGQDRRRFVQDYALRRAA